MAPRATPVTLRVSPSASVSLASSVATGIDNTPPLATEAESVLATGAWFPDAMVRLMVAVLESSCPSLALKVNRSAPE